MVVLEENGYTDWRGVKPEEIDEAIRSIHRNGGIVGIAHPFSLSDPINTGYHRAFQIKDCLCPTTWKYGQETMRPAVFRASGPLKCGKNPFRGYRINAMTGRDWHKDDGLPCCYTWVGCEGELTAPKLLDAIRGGHICLGAGPLLTMEAEVPGENGSGKKPFPAEKHSRRTRRNLRCI